MYCMKKSFYLFIFIVDYSKCSITILLVYHPHSPHPQPRQILWGSPSQHPLSIIFMNPDPRKKSAFNLLLDLNDKNHDLSFAPNLVIFPNPKILVLQNDFFLSFLSSLFRTSYQGNNKVDYMYIYIYFYDFLL